MTEEHRRKLDFLRKNPLGIFCGEAAKILGVNRKTVNDMAEKGLISCRRVRLFKQRTRVFIRSEIYGLLRQDLTAVPGLERVFVNRRGDVFVASKISLPMKAARKMTSRGAHVRFVISGKRYCLAVAKLMILAFCPSRHADLQAPGMVYFEFLDGDPNNCSVENIVIRHFRTREEQEAHKKQYRSNYYRNRRMNHNIFELNRVLQEKLSGTTN